LVRQPNATSLPRGRGYQTHPIKSVGVCTSRPALPGGLGLWAPLAGAPLALVNDPPERTLLPRAARGVPPCVRRQWPAGRRSGRSAPPRSMSPACTPACSTYPSPPRACPAFHPWRGGSHSNLPHTHTPLIPIHGGPGAPPIALARVMLPSTPPPPLPASPLSLSFFPAHHDPSYNACLHPSPPQHAPRPAQHLLLQRRPARPSTPG
jgi:hypothetical protein